ncbi:RdgB/HAM1 family non-canonical purine NTP pyrophosphatase [Calidifontibacter sp. DB0510]|uniref:dITP/XTP pyrophosphatase n=1 Tax=Metallococcus carri TaxID=1656884 RepID=A0A967B502_9MICO|nr:RdgB/HAM1 family non-canonical purine NTP pyrophosphatase [Metallococcus carri]NHN55737.1 RdgB/HAM1 family non-canonical purine NTP pyrophosphatase [Metallococcus carri]NOP38574.1 RdgB/HAM1 family non-canonical purine NTP pyrophosphatase [Calidifontibacter sp. DB2511S]
MSTIVLATRNAGKLAELQHLVAADDRLAALEVVSVASYAHLEDVVESGVTFEENASLKAHQVARETNLPAVADDSGLSVDVLNGCPGVFSARWSGRHGADQANIDLLLAQTRDVPEHLLTAAFHCSVVLAWPDGRSVAVAGRVDGRLTRNQRGDNGFGYDPIFELPDGRTMAELTADEKAAISHRGKAFRALLPQLVALMS